MWSGAGRGCWSRCPPRRSTGAPSARPGCTPPPPRRGPRSGTGATTRTCGKYLESRYKNICVSTVHAPRADVHGLQDVGQPDHSAVKLQVPQAAIQHGAGSLHALSASQLSNIPRKYFLVGKIFCNVNFVQSLT